MLDGDSDLQDEYPDYGNIPRHSEELNEGKKWAEQYFEFHNSIDRKIAFVDVTHLLLDELEAVANGLGYGQLYKQVSENNSFDPEMVVNYMPLLKGRNPFWVAEQMQKADPYEGAAESIQLLKEAGYEVIAVTDDPLFASPETQAVLKDKFGIDKVYTTSFPSIENGAYTGKVDGYRRKDEIVREIIEREKPTSVVNVIEGENDLPMVEATKKYASKIYTKVFGVNSNSQKVKDAVDVHVTAIDQLPPYLNVLT